MTSAGVVSSDLLGVTSESPSKSSSAAIKLPDSINADRWKSNPLSSADAGIAQTIPTNFKAALEGKNPPNARNITLQARTWFEMSEDDELKQELSVQTVTYLQRRVAASNASQNNVYALPMDLKEKMPLLASWFELAVKASKCTFTYDGPALGTVLHLAAWSPDSAQTYLDSLQIEASKATRRLLISITDFFQSFVRTIELPITEPSSGLFRAGVLFIEVYQEKVHNVPRSKTAAVLGRQALRNTLLDQMKQVFPNEGTAAYLMNLTEILMLKTFHTYAGRIDELYVKGITEAIRPSVTTQANFHFRKVTEVVKRVIAAKGQQRARTVEQSVTKTLPPSVPSSVDELKSVTSSSERELLKTIQKTIQKSLSEEGLRACRSDDLQVQAVSVKAIIESTYTLADAVKSEIKRRNGDVKTKCLAKARQLVEKGEKADLKAAFTADLWQATAAEYMRDLDPDTTDDLFEIVTNVFNLDCGCETSDAPYYFQEWLRNKVTLAVEAHNATIEQGEEHFPSLSEK
jgi:hypothetical protein